MTQCPEQSESVEARSKCVCVRKWNKERARVVYVQKRTRGAEERGAGVAAGHGHNGRHHQVLDEGTRDDDLNRQPFLGCNRVNERLGTIPSRECCWGKLGETGRLRALNAVAEEIEYLATTDTTDARSIHGLGKRDVHVLVHLLIVDDDVF